MSERTSTRWVLGSTADAMVEMWPSKVRFGNAMTLTLTSWPTLKAGLSLSATLASIHMVDTSATV